MIRNFDEPNSLWELVKYDHDKGRCKPGHCAFCLQEQEDHAKDEEERKDRRMSEKLYSLEEIKRAFWKKFHEAGEVWLNYLGTKEENEESTEVEWKEFLECLNEK